MAAAANGHRAIGVGEEAGQQRRAFVAANAAVDARVVIEARFGKEIDHRAACAGLGIARAKDDPRQARMHDRARAHRARLERDVELAAGKPVVAERARRRRASAAISACAVGSLASMGALPPRPMIVPSRTTIAPTGTSPRAPAARASASASPIRPSSASAIGAAAASLMFVRSLIVAMLTQLADSQCRGSPTPTRWWRAACSRCRTRRG